MSNIFFIGDNQIRYGYIEDYDGEPNDVDIEHIQSMIEAGFLSGQLCTSEMEMTYLGWWELESRFDIELESVELIASGYEWTCPHCDNLNREIELNEEVECEECGRTFSTGEAHHAFG